MLVIKRNGTVLCLYSGVISLAETSPTSLYRMDSEAHDYDVMEDLKANKLFDKIFFPPPILLCSYSSLVKKKIYRELTHINRAALRKRRASAAFHHSGYR